MSLASPVGQNSLVVGGSLFDFCNWRFLDRVIAAELENFCRDKAGRIS
jgi:hypothetical protein